MHWFWRATIAVVTTYIAAELVYYPINRAFAPRWNVSLVQWLINDLKRPWWSFFLRFFFVLMPILVYNVLSRFAPSTDNPSETRCRKCNYILRGISEPRCPECGERI